MNLLSFVDELVKVGSFSRIIKIADQGGENSDIPSGMMSSEGVPDSIDVRPHDATTRTPKSHLPSIVESGNMGDISEAKDPLDRERYNRAYGDGR